MYLFEIKATPERELRVAQHYLAERGYFETPESSANAAFVRDWFDVGAGRAVDVKELYADCPFLSMKSGNKPHPSTPSARRCM